MLNFYRKFIKNAALKGPGKLLDWTPPLDAAFRRGCFLPLLCPSSCIPSLVLPISFAVDASDTHVGGVL